MIRNLLMLLACVVLVAGCSSQPPPPEPMPAADHARVTLQQAAQDGQVGSDVLALQGYFEELKATDPAKAESLLKDLDEMIKVGTTPSGSGSQRVKQKAQEMLEKL